MLVYNPSQSIHPWSRQEHDCGRAGTLSQHTYGYDSSMVADSGLDNNAYAVSSLGQFTNAGTDMLQASLLLQPQQQGQASQQAPLAQLLSGSLNLAQVPSLPVLSQPPTNLHAAPSPPQLLPTSNLGSAQQQVQGCRVFMPESLTPAAIPTNPLQGPADLQMFNDSTNLLPVLQEQLIAQALQQQQQQLTMTPQQPTMQAALAAAMCTGAATQQSLPLQPVPSALPISSQPTFPYQTGVADAAVTSAAAAMAAAFLVQQQQPATAASPSSSTVAGISSNPLLQQLLISQPHAVQHTPGAPVSMNMINQLQPWAVKALTTQLQQLSSNINQAAFNQQQMALASLVGSTPATCAGRPTGTSTLPGRRPRNARRSSGCVVAGFDMAGASSSYAAASRACSSAGSDHSLGLDGRPSGGISVVLPEGITLEHLTSSTYQDTWTALDCKAAGTTSSGNGMGAAGSLNRSESCQLSPKGSAAHSSSCSMASSSTLSDGAASSCSSTSSLSSSSKQDGSGTSGVDKWQWDSHFCSLDSGAAACASGIAGRASRSSAARSPDVRQATEDDTKSSPDQDAHTCRCGVAAAGEVAGGCTVWVPGPREMAGDDSWYLPRPPTCRLFVGNIGCWVDEAMLLAYFGKYGHVVDVQVMWNTKMLARGRRVNREFAFISYSNPLEAARAVHWLDGCRLPDLEKDKNGVTVEYENGEGDSPAGKP